MTSSRHEVTQNEHRGHVSRLQGQRSGVKEALSVCVCVTSVCLETFFFVNRNFFLLPAHSTSDLFLSRSVTTPANWPKMSLGSYLINSRRMEAERALIPAFFEGGNIIAIETLVTSSHQRPTQNKVPIIFPCLIFSPVIFPHSAILYSFRNFNYNFKCLL